MNKLLIVVDFQNDFVDGALGFDDADKLDGKICDRIKKQEKTMNKSSSHSILTKKII